MKLFSALMALVLVITLGGDLLLNIHSLNHHDDDGNGGPDIGHLVKLNMKAKLAGRREQLPEVVAFQST